MASTLSGTSSDEGEELNQYGKRGMSNNGMAVKRLRPISMRPAGVSFTSGGTSQSDSDDPERPSFQPSSMRPAGVAFTAGAGTSQSDSDDPERPTFGGMGGMGMGSLGFKQASEESKDLSEEVADDFTVKGNKTKTVEYSSAAQKMMAMMGYKKGTGLGKKGQGRVAPVESSKHKGRRGLGMTPSGFEQVDVEWRFEKEVVAAEETVDWIPDCDKSPPSLDDMIQYWMAEGEKKMTIDDETKFCNPQVLKKVLSCKDIFDSLEGEEMRKARTKSNPYETIRGVFFLNRAAMKMANMDAVTDYMFTKPTYEDGQSMILPDELLYFCDVCAGPGGFSEYVLWRRKCDTKGFGFTLKGPCDFKLEEFFAAPSEYFEPHYGVADDGDIYNPKNLISFRKFVMESTNNRGVHFVTADGGFSVEGQENLQEILSKRLYLCQFLCALSVLREGGHFTCKLFDIFTPFSVGLVYLMYRAFKQVSIFKPVTSRPANSERYIICKGKRADAEVIHDYMFEINKRLNEFGELGSDTVTECVPYEVMREDEEFFSYIVESNQIIGTAQAIALSKIKTFAQNNDLMEERQTDMRSECLRLWNVPDKVRIAPDRSIPANMKFSNLLGLTDTKAVDMSFEKEVQELTAGNLSSLRSVFNYRCLLAGTNETPGSKSDVAERWFLLGFGKSFVFKWNGNKKTNWTKESSLNIELPGDTILEVEYVQELRGEAKAQRKVTCVHIIDGMFLGGQDIRKMHFTERHEKLRRFVKAISRTTRKDLAPMRVKDIYRLEEIESVFNRMAIKQMKGGGQRKRLCYCGEDDSFYVIATGLYLIKITEDPWSLEFSRSAKRKYFYNGRTKDSRFECPSESIADYKSCLKDRMLWLWKGVKLHSDQLIDEDPSKLSREAVSEFIHQRTPR